MKTERKRKVAICTNCGKRREIKGKDRCSACINYYRRTGIERPAYLYDRKTTCVQCGKKPVKYRQADLCQTCYNYRNKNGSNRPEYMIRDLCKNPNCGRPLMPLERARGRCKTCHNFLVTTGYDRPLRLTRFISEEGYQPCKNPNCDKPVNERGKRSGYCFSCLKYLKDNGQDRPRHLCPQADPFPCGHCNEPAIKRRIAGKYAVWVCAYCECKYIPVEKWSSNGAFKQLSH